MNPQYPIWMPYWLGTASDIVLLRLGDGTLTLGTLVKLIILVAALFWFASALRGWLSSRVLRRLPVDEGTRIAIASMLRYLVLILGMVLILQNVGINLSALGVVAGAVGVGVGFGLQNIVSNFISGVIIMLERPIKVGDRIEVGGVEGVVREISARRTTLVTMDNVAILIPNQRFIVENVINSAYLEEPVRLSLGHFISQYGYGSAGRAFEADRRGPSTHIDFASTRRASPAGGCDLPAV